MDYSVIEGSASKSNSKVYVKEGCVAKSLLNVMLKVYQII